MRLFALVTLSIADFAVAPAQPATPDSENGRYSFNPVADGVLRLPDERSVLEAEIAACRARTQH
jgi:hypothetical protein